jgi:hypothetical protein
MHEDGTMGIYAIYFGIYVNLCWYMEWSYMQMEKTGLAHIHSFFDKEHFIT